MTTPIRALLLALSLTVPTAWAAIPGVTINPGDTLAPTESTVYTGSVFVNGAFSHSYYVDFTTYPHDDLWTFAVYGIGQSLDGVPVTGLTSLSMSLVDTTGGGATPLWSHVATSSMLYSENTPSGLLEVTLLNAYDAGMYAPPTAYRLDVAGSGTGYYDITATIPEPETWAMFIIGAVLVGLRLRSGQPSLG